MMKFLTRNLFSTHYSVRFRLVTFVITTVFLVVVMSVTAIIGLNHSYHALTDLRNQSLNQMFSTMTLGVKTAQIATNTTRLTQTVDALEYQSEAQILSKQAEELHRLLNQVKDTDIASEAPFVRIVDAIHLLEQDIQELLQQTHKRHLLHTGILSHLHQNLLYFIHIKRLAKKSTVPTDYLQQVEKIEKLIENATQSSFSPNLFLSIQSVLSFLPDMSDNADIYEEQQKVRITFTHLIEEAHQLAEVKLRIKFLTYQIDALVKKIDSEYNQLALTLAGKVNKASANIQDQLSQKTLFIGGFAAITILLIMVVGWYIYFLIGKRLFSITQSLKKFSQGDKAVQIPQQQAPDEIGDLARAFHSFQHDLSHYQKMQTMGHLTGGIAHDFNNFLAVIMANLDLIDLENLPERQAKRILRAMKAAENSATLTQRLLAYARKQPLHPSNVNINQLLLDFQDFMKHSLPPAIKVRLNLAENLPLVYMDKSQLETALVNLIVNAKDAMNGVGTINIQTQQLCVQRTHRREQMVQISIQDEGCGMDQETQNRVFEPFFTTKKNGRGSGLGLSMVYGFVRQSKGRVVIQSALGQGTQVHLQLPMSKTEPELTALSGELPRLSGQLYSLLLVEDNGVLRETLTEQLKEMGYQVEAVESGEQAIAYLQHHAVNYVLSDIVLADKISGIEVADFVRQHQPEAKILLMTGHTTQLSTRYAVLNKPFKQQELQQALQKA